MIIRRITLKNIRSYHSPEPIHLTTGVTLFEGDIGSGKSTILSGIEFALFGLGDVDGAYLLRHGEKTGSVLLEFDVSGKEYKVYRSLEKKRSSVTQKEGYIVEHGVRTSYSVTEMKSRVLEILNFNECARPKTSSLIYRYAVFTPQEMMKEVLSQPVERRLETLRRAFRIEDYSVIINNTSIMLSWLGRESTFLDGQTRDIGEKRLQLEEENKKRQAFESSLDEITRQRDSLKEEVDDLLAKIRELQPKKESVVRLDAEIPPLESALESKKEQLHENQRRTKTLQNQLSDINDAEGLLKQIGPVYDEYCTKKAKTSELEPSIQEIRDLTTKRSNLETAIEKEEKHLREKIADIEGETSREAERLAEKREAIEEIPELQQREGGLSKELEELPKVSERLSTLKQEHAALKQDAKNNKARIKELETEFEDLQRIGVGAPCPKCKQELTPVHYAKVEQDYKRDILALKAKVEERNNEAQKIHSEIETASQRQEELNGFAQELNELKPKIAALKKQEETINENQETLNSKLLSLEEWKERLSKENYAQNERAELTVTISKLEKLEPIKKEYETLKERIKTLEKEKIEEQYHSNKSKIENKDAVVNEITKNMNQEKTLTTQIVDDGKTLDEKKSEYNKEKRVVQQLTALEAEKEIADQNYQNKNEELVEAKKDVQTAKDAISRIKGEINTREDQLLRFHEMKQYENWLSEFFIPAVKLIETNVLTNINSEFNSLFQKWLGHLLETGDITVRVDDKFTPIIEQNGYEMDVNSLSGGEKTSVALAYRLALNVMVKKVCEAMQSNLLILDEPTDGFSREQLFRLRDILKELNCEQVIAVSHESELEGFVDKIYRITKEAGESKIALA